MFLWIVPLCCSIVVVKIQALPTVENYTQQIRTLNPEQCKSCTQLDDVIKQTMDLGLVALEHISEAALSFGSLVSDVASDFFSTSLKHMRKFMKASQKMFSAHFKDVKRFGKEGFKLLEEVLSTGGDFLIDTLSKLPMVKQHPNSADETCTKSDRLRSLEEFFDL